MSAYHVSKVTIDILVSFAIEHRIYGRLVMGEQHEQVTLANANAFGRLLWSENAKSLDARYSDARGDMYEPAEIAGYRLSRFIDIKPEAAIGCADCLEYQSCEHDGWKTSLACEFLRAIKYAAVSKAFPNKPWGIRDEEHARAFATPVDRFDRAGRPASPVMLSTLAANVVPLRRAVADLPEASRDTARAILNDAFQARPETLHNAAPAFPAPAPRQAKAKAAPAPKAETAAPIVADKRAFEALRARMTERFAAQRNAPQRKR